MTKPLDPPTALRRLRRQTAMAGALWAAALGQAAVLMAGIWGAAASLRWLLQAALVAVGVLVALCRMLTLNRGAEETLLRPSLGPANGITLLRAAGVAALAGFLFHSPVVAPDSVWLSWTPGILYLIVSVLDAFDGYLARVTDSETRLGERLDVEVDALGLLVASTLLVCSGKAPVFYLAVGLGVYGLRGATAVRRMCGMPVGSVPPRMAARWIAGCEMGSAGLALLPPFGTQAVAVAAVVMTVALLGSLAWDWLLICGKGAAAARVSARCRKTVACGLPLVLRSVLAAATIAAAAGQAGSGGWAGGIATAAAIGCVLGLAARLAAMVLSATTALLLSSADPGSGTGAVLLCAVSLLLTGAGPLRLWQPEDRWLLKRHGKARHPVTPASSLPGPTG